jgi:hypothetical protein
MAFPTPLGPRFLELVASFPGTDAFAGRGVVGNHEDEDRRRRCHRMNESAEEACKDIEQHPDERSRYMGGRIGEAGIVFLLRWPYPSRTIAAEYLNL